MQKEYIDPEIELVSFKTMDIIVTSDEDEGPIITPGTNTTEDEDEGPIITPGTDTTEDEDEGPVIPPNSNSQIVDQ